jgi:RNA polymerase sigma-70 factor (ECF subfamily)
LDTLRARKRRHGDRQFQYQEGDALMTERKRPDVIASSTRWHQALRQAFQRLDADQRAVLELSYFQGMSHGQIADALQLPVGTVKSRILAGMRSLRTTLPIIHRAMKR